MNRRRCTDTAAAIAEVRERLREGTARIGGVGEVAEGSRAALRSMVEGLGRTVEFIERIAREVEAQASAMEGLRGDMGRVRQIAAGTVERARGTAAEADEQWNAMEELAGTSRRTAETAAALRALAARFRADGAADNARSPAPTPAAARENP